MYPDVSSCRWLTPLAQAGMKTPTGVPCLAKLAIYLSPSTSLSLFPPLSFIPLSFSYLYRLLFDFVFAPFPFLSFAEALGFLTCSPFSGNGLAPRSSHMYSDGPYIQLPGQAARDTPDISDGTLALRFEDCALRTWHLKRGHALPRILDGSYIVLVPE